MVNKRERKKQSKFVKVISSLALVTTVLIQSPSYGEKSVKAMDLPVMDTQGTCNVGGDSSKTSSNDASPKDENINMKKYKSTFEKNAKGGKLEGKSDKILEIADEEKVPGLLMVAIVVNESGWGKGANAMKQNNPMSVMGSKSIEDSKYDTIEDGLHAGAENLYTGYIKKGLDTPKKIGPKYAPVGASNDPDDMNSNWIPMTEKVMKDLGAEGGEASSSDDDEDDESSKDKKEDKDKKDKDKNKDKSKEESEDKSSDDEEESEGASSADSDSDTTTSSVCGDDEDKDSGSSSGGTTDGKIGKSVKANGKKGKMVDGSWTYDKVPEKYKKHIELPKLNEKYLKGSPFEANGQDKGQCTEFTWAMMNQLYPKEQPAFDGITNGQDVHKIYSKRGAKTTHNPTVGYGFSSTPPYALAKIPGVGHTGVVAGVMDDGKFIIAQYNVDPDPAPSRTVLYSVIDGVPKDAGDDLIFFEGVGGEPRKEYKKK